MALQTREEHEGRLLIVNVSGVLTTADYELFLPEVDRLVKMHGTIRILFDMRDFHGWRPGAIWEDLKFAFDHFSNIERLAVVGEKRWQHALTSFCRPFTKGDIRYFDRSQEEQAHVWMEEEMLVLK